ncbi:MAG: hypothetical protein HQM08_14485 [Candidatus Riflebacteria bacterium]|nr:hypothetical protein [Candidatus Riflebacteria bacterium]
MFRRIVKGLVVGSLLLFTTGVFAQGNPMMPPPSKEQMQKMMTEFANQNGFTVASDSSGRLIVKDKNGNVVPFPPPPPMGMGMPPGMPPMPPSKEQMQKMMTEFANQNGFTVASDSSGRLIVKDKNGNEVPFPPPPPMGMGMPPGMSPMPPSKEQMQKMMTEFANQNGFTLATDSSGRLIMKDKNGNEVPFPPPPPMGMGMPPFPPGLASSTTGVSSAAQIIDSSSTSSSTSNPEDAISNQ